MVSGQEYSSQITIEGMKTETYVCGILLKDYINELKRFHSEIAPGVLLGGFMVDLAYELIGSDVESDAIVETRHCLPDAIQILTPCTTGNGWMQVLDWDKFALTLFDRMSREGFRVWFDLEKARLFPNLYKWYMREIPKKDLPLDVLHEIIIEAGRSVFSSCAIGMTDFYKRIKKGDIKICPGCGEAYPTAQGNKCTTCQGEGYYELRS